MLDPATVGSIAAAFGLGRPVGEVEPEPSARGRLGDIWRLDTTSGSYAVKTTDHPRADAEVAVAAGFQEAAADAGIPTPRVMRTQSGGLVATVGARHVSVQAWVEMLEPYASVDVAEVAQLVAGLHRVDFDGGGWSEPWFTDPIGVHRWDELLRRLDAADAPFAAELGAQVAELVRLEWSMAPPPAGLRTCHRDLWADNVRATPGGGLVVFDFENCGPADPSQELAMVLFEFCSGRPQLAERLAAAYVDAGGSGRVASTADFSMAIALQSHILEFACRSWLGAAGAERADLDGWVREFTDRPMTPAVVEELLDAVRGSTPYGGQRHS